MKAPAYDRMGVDYSEAMAPGLPRRVEKPWGHEVWFAHTDRAPGNSCNRRESDAYARTRLTNADLASV